MFYFKPLACKFSYFAVVEFVQGGVVHILQYRLHDAGKVSVAYNKYRFSVVVLCEEVEEFVCSLYH